MLDKQNEALKPKTKGSLKIRLYSRVQSNLAKLHSAFQKSRIVIFIQRHHKFFKAIFFLFLGVVIIFLKLSPRFLKLARAVDDFQPRPEDAKEVEKLLRDRYSDLKPIRPRRDQLLRPENIDLFVKQMHLRPSLKFLMAQQAAREASSSFVSKYIFPNPSPILVVGVVGVCGYIIVREYYRD